MAKATIRGRQGAIRGPFRKSGGRAPRQPGDLHVHFFGTATLSFADGIETQEGDVFEVSANAFTLPVSNPLVYGSQDGIVAVRSL